MFTTESQGAQGAPVAPTCDRDLAAAYVAALTGSPHTGMDWRALSDTDKSLPGHAKRGTLSDLWPWITGMNAAGYGVFANVSELDGQGRELPNVTAIRAHVVDLDNADAEQQRAAAAGWSPAPTFQVETSPGRFHVYWCLSERYKDNDRFTALQRRIRQQWNGDKAVVDPTRILRLPGTWNWKREVPHLVRYEALAGYGQPLTVDQLEASLSHVVVQDGGTGERHELGQPDLAAPSLDWLKRALDLVDPNMLDRGEWISLTAAVKQAGWTLTDEGTLRGLWSDWCSTYEANNPAENEKQWRSIRDSQLGWHSLVARIPSLKAQSAFGDHAPPLPAGASDTRLPVAVNTGDERFWATFGADDGARSTSVAALRTLAESGLPIRHDQFADRIVLCGPVPWDRVGPFPRQWEDIDTTGCKAVLEMSYLKPSKETTLDAVAFVAKRDAFHPVRDYLDALQWDGVGRLDQMATLYMGADDTPFARLATAKFMIQAVARIQEPGCLARAMLILEGEQGIRKSTFANELFGDDWFADDLPDMSNKDAVLQLRGKWGIEIGEMVSATKSEVRAVKRFMAAKRDTYRPPYGRATIDAPRHTVFVGTTNDYEYLTDPTGNSRFWPIACTRFNIEALRRDRDQLWAEAMHRYRAGEPWWMSEQEEELAAIEQEARRVPDPWEVRVLEFVAYKVNGGDDTFSVDDALGKVGITLDRRDMLAQKRMSGVLRALHCDHPKIKGLKRWRASERTKQRIERERIERERIERERIERERIEREGTVGTVEGPYDGKDGPPKNPQKT